MNNRDVISLISKIRQKVNGFIVSEISQNGIEGIVVSHGDIIYALYKKHKLSMAEIAEKIGKDKSTVTALVDKLVRLGYVTKDKAAEDTRIVYVTLTPKGRELEPIFEAISHKVLEIFYLNISEEETEVLIRILSKIENNF